MNETRLRELSVASMLSLRVFSEPLSVNGPLRSKQVFDAVTSSQDLDGGIDWHITGISPSVETLSVRIVTDEVAILISWIWLVQSAIWLLIRSAISGQILTLMSLTLAVLLLLPVASRSCHPDAEDSTRALFAVQLFQDLAHGRGRRRF